MISTLAAARPAPRPASENPNPGRPQQPPPGPPPSLPQGAQSPRPQPPAPPPAPAPAHKLPFEKPTTTTITRTFDLPVLNATKLGSIPVDYYEWTWGWPRYGFGWENHYNCGGNGACENGPVDIVRDVPEYNADNSPKMKTVTETITGTTYNQAYRTVGCGLMAAAAGVGGSALLAACQGTPAVPAAMILGGLAGAAAGALLGYKTAAGDKLAEVWTKHTIDHPTMNGFSEWIQPSYHFEEDCYTVPDGNGGTRQECTTREVLDGYWHQYSPDISWKQVGNYTRPTLQHTNPIGTGAAVALAAVGGVLLGVGMAAILAAG